MAELADQAARADEERLTAALADAEPHLIGVALRVCDNEADARDLVQDAFERVARLGVPGDIRNIRAWLTTVVHNLFIDRCRARHRRPPHQHLDDDRAGITQMEPDPAEPPWMEITIDHIRAALDELEPVYREVYFLHTFEHQSYQQIAATLKVSPITVGTRLTRARKKLREVLVARFGLERPR